MRPPLYLQGSRRDWLSFTILSPERPQPAGLLIAAPGPHSLENQATQGRHHTNQLSSSAGSIHTDWCLFFDGGGVGGSLGDGLFSSH